MHGDYEELYPADDTPADGLGRWGWGAVLQAVLVVGLVLFCLWLMLVAGAAPAPGAEPSFAAFEEAPASFEAFGPPAAGKERSSDPGHGLSLGTPPPVLLGWRHWDGAGREWFVPAGEAPAPVPFPPADTTEATTAPSAGVLNIASPAPDRFRGRTGTSVLPVTAGGTGCPTGYG